MPRGWPCKAGSVWREEASDCENKSNEKIINYTSNTTEWIETDTLPVGKQILFEADGNYSNYEWQILGDTTKYYNKNQIFKFDYIWGELTIRLVVFDKPDTLCFPNDDVLIHHSRKYI